MTEFSSADKRYREYTPSHSTDLNYAFDVHAITKALNAPLLTSIQKVLDEAKNEIIQQVLDALETRGPQNGNANYRRDVPGRPL